MRGLLVKDLRQILQQKKFFVIMLLLAFFLLNYSRQYKRAQNLL